MVAAGPVFSAAQTGGGSAKATCAPIAAPDPIRVPPPSLAVDVR